MTRKTTDKPSFAGLLERYGCGPIQFTGTGDALYERHLMFDNVADPAEAGPREQYEALARSVRDVLSQRWRRTEQTYDRENPKRVYYLSMEFLIGRSLANNVLNLLLDPVARSIVEEAKLDWPALLEEEPDAGLGNGGLGRLAACFLDSMATMQLPAMGYGLRYEYGIFRQTIEDGWQHEQPDNWLRLPRPLGGRPAAGGGRGQAGLLVRGARRHPARDPRQAVDADRHSLRSPGRGLRRQDHQHAPALGRRDARLLRLPGVQRRRVRQRPGRAARGRVADAGALSRRFDDHGTGACASCRSISWSPARWPISCGASGGTTPTGARFPTRSPSSSTTPIPAWRSRS